MYARSGKISLGAKETLDPAGIHGTRGQIPRLDYRRFPEEGPNRFEVIGQLPANLGRRAIERTPVLDPFQSGLRSDSLHAIVEVRTHHDREVDELFPADLVVLQHLLSFDQLRSDCPKRRLARQKFLARFLDDLRARNIPEAVVGRLRMGLEM